MKPVSTIRSEHLGPSMAVALSGIVANIQNRTRDEREFVCILESESAMSVSNGLLEHTAKPVGNGTVIFI